MTLSAEALAALRELAEYPLPEPLLNEAMTHRSAVAEKGGNSYDRLEFLGDSVLQLITTEALYERYPRKDEGWMTRTRQRLVSQPTLAALGREMGLERWIMADAGALRAGTTRLDSVVCDAVEAFLAVLYLARGLDATREFILPRLEPMFHSAGRGAPDAKSALQELLQSHGTVQIAYVLLEHTGMPPRETFTVEVRCDGQPLAVGTGSSKKLAEQEAAAAALAEISTDEKGKTT
ncbi:MAG: ribonuclease III [Christensenellales bacterium]|jgi:ribonuclease-3